MGLKENINYDPSLLTVRSFRKQNNKKRDITTTDAHE